MNDAVIYFLTVLRYIHQNLIKAKIVKAIVNTQSRQIVDKEYALNMFSDKPDEAVMPFAKFLREANEDICLEIPEIKVNVSDDDLRQMVRQEFGIDAIEICNEKRKKQDNIESNERSCRH